MSEHVARVLMLSDEIGLCDYVARYLLQSHGCVVDRAANGMEVLELLERADHEYHIAVLDTEAVSDAQAEHRVLWIDLIPKLKAHFTNIEYIVLASNASMRLEALRAGVRMIIQKPFHAEELALLIQQAIEIPHLKHSAHTRRTTQQAEDSLPRQGTTPNHQETLEVVLHSMKGIGFDRVRLYLLSDDKTAMVGQIHIGMDPSFVGLVLPIKDDPYAQSLLNDPQPRIFRREEYDIVPFEQQLAKERVDQWACVPLLLQGQVIGKVSVDNKFTNQPIDSPQLNQVALFATLAATAIENVRLRNKEHETALKATKRMKIIEAIQKHSTEISTLRDLDAILATTCKAASDLFDIDHSGLVRFAPDHVCGWVVAEYPKLKMEGIEIPVQGVEVEEHLIKDREPLVISDVRAEPELGSVAQILEQFDIRSILIVPIILNDQVWGSFSLDAIGRTQVFSSDEIDLCVIFASHVAAAVHNAYLFSEVKRRADELETVRKTTFAVTSQLNRDELLKIIIQQALVLLKAKSGGIYEYYPERGELLIIADHGRPDYVLGNSLRTGEGMAGRLVQSGEPYMIVDDYNSWPDRAAIYADQRPFGAVLEVPLIWQTDPIGILYVDDEVGRKFKAEDAELLRLFADHAAIALVNANLVTKDMGKARRLEKLAQAIDEIMGNLGTLSLVARLELIARHATDILDAEACGISLVKQPGILSFEASYGYQANGYKQGKEFVIRTGTGTGLTGHIAYKGELFNAHGDALTSHFAVRGHEPSQTLSGRCYSLLAIPLRQGGNDDAPLIGLLRVDNKKDRRGQANPTVGFTAEDESLLRLFADVVVVAIESAELVAQLSEQKDHFGRLVASSPNGVVDVDRYDRIIGLNVRAQAVLGYELEEVLHQPVEMLYDNPDDWQEVRRLLATLPGGKLANHESAYRTKTGAAIPIRLAATLLYDAQANQIGSVAYFEDLRSINEIKQRLGILWRASKVLNQAEHLTEGLLKLAEMLTTLLGASFCRIFLLDDSQEYLVAKAVYPTTTELLDWQPGLEERTAVAEWPKMLEFLNAGKPRLLRIEGKRSRNLLVEWSQRLGLATTIQSMLVIPLRTRHKVVGLIDLADLQANELDTFTRDKQDLAELIANQTAMWVDRMWLHEHTEQREQLLSALDESSRHIRAEKEPQELLQNIVRLAVDLVGYTAGGLYINYAQREELELTVTYGLSEDLIGHRQSHQDGLIGKVAQTKSSQVGDERTNWTEQEAIFEQYQFKTLVGIPLKQKTGTVEAVLFVASDSAQPVSKTSLEVLERFADQAAIALQTSQFISQEQGLFRYLAILHTISDYIQAARDLDKILHAVLTGVTAGYGLGFNRATLLLLDESRQYLIGQMGIGHLLQVDAERDWEQDRQHHLESFKQVRELLDQKQVVLTPIGERIRGLRLPVQSQIDDVFSEVIESQRWKMVTPDQLDRLPDSFRQAFEPTTDLLVGPLIAQSVVIGLLAVDNKFTQAPITEVSQASLQSFADTAAIAIYNNQLFQESDVAHDRLRSFYAASNALVSYENFAQVLKNIVEQARQAAGATGVSMALVDQTGYVRSVITAGVDQQSGVTDIIRPNGLSVQVLQTGQAVLIEDTEKQRERVNPSMFWRGVRAALCLPVSLEGKTSGVMWLHYDHPRHFSPSEIDAIRLYVNQAAIIYDNARRIEELKHIRHATEMLANTSGRRAVLEQIALNAHSVLQADSAVVWSYDAARNMLTPESMATTDGLVDLWDGFQRGPLRSGGTAHEVMTKGWVGIEDVNDVERYPYLGSYTRILLERIGAQSSQGIVLSVGDEKIGLLYLNYNRPRIFGQEDSQAAQTFARQAGLALKNANLVDQLSRARNAARMVAEVTVLSRDLQRTLSLVAEGIVDALDCDAVTMYVYDSRNQQISHRPITVGLMLPERVSMLSDIPANSIVAKMLHQDQLYLAEDVSKDPYFKDSRFTREEHIATCVVIPLRLGNEKVGVIFINYRSQHQITRDELINIQLFAHQAAVAIQNARRLDELEQLQSAVDAYAKAAPEKELYEELQGAYKKLEEQDRRKTEFLSIVSHELRTPLTHIHSCIENMLAELYGPVTSQQLDRLTYALASAREERRLIGNLLDLARIQAARVELDLELASIVTIIKEIMAVYEYDAKLKMINLVAELPEDDSLEIVIDRVKIRQVFVNLVSNALKFTPAEGTVKVSAKRRTAEIEIKVSDTGMGIPADEIDKIFDYFYRGSRVGVVVGTGVGLSIAKEFVELHKGRIQVKSIVGRGSTFIVMLPFPT